MDSKVNEEMSTNDGKCASWMTDGLWNKLNVGNADFAFDQGEKYLAEQCRISNSLMNRGYSLFGFVLVACPFVISAAIQIGGAYMPVIAYMITSVFIGLSISLMGIVCPYKGFGVGRKPKEVLDEADIDHANETKESSLKKYQIENLQYKIEQTEKLNTERAIQLRIILYVLITCIAVSLVSIATFISW